MILVSGNYNQPLAKKIATELGLALAKTKIKTFADGETYVRIKENLKRQTVVVIQSCSLPANDSLMELLLLMDAVRQQQPKKIIALLPFYPYRRQERMVAQGEPISAQLVAKLIEAAGADRVMLLELHTSAIIDFFKIPVTHVSTLSLFADALKRQISRQTGEWLVIAPDEGASEKAFLLAESLKLDWAAIKKIRKQHDKIASMSLAKSIKGKNVILFDDEISTGGTIVKAVELLKKKAVAKIIVAVTHGLFVDSALKNLSRLPLEKIYVTDSLNQKSKKNLLKTTSVAKLLAENIKKI